MSIIFELIPRLQFADKGQSTEHYNCTSVSARSDDSGSCIRWHFQIYTTLRISKQQRHNFTIPSSTMLALYLLLSCSIVRSHTCCSLDTRLQPILVLTWQCAKTLSIRCNLPKRNVIFLHSLSVLLIDPSPANSEKTGKLEIINQLYDTQQVLNI